MGKITPLISVLVPVYNAEKFISRCLDSILAQTYSNLEVICIDDGSVDRSRRILRFYANKDKRVRVFTSKHQGTASIRAWLLKEVKGEYFTFVDADDWIGPQFIELLYQEIQTSGADVVRCLYYLADMNSKTLIPCESVYKVFLKPVPAKAIAARIQAGLDDSQVWLKLIRTEFVRRHNITFFPGIKVEDLSFEILLYLHATKIIFLPQHLYYYQVGNDYSVSADKKSWAQGTLQNLLALLQDVQKREFTDPQLYGRLIGLIFHAVRRLRKYPQNLTITSLCRNAFNEIERSIFLCIGWNKIKYKTVVLAGRIVPDKWLPWLSVLVR